VSPREWIWLGAAWAFLGACFLLRHSGWMWLTLAAAVFCAVMGDRSFRARLAPPVTDTEAGRDA
jgi:hypothetical protein